MHNIDHLLGILVGLRRLFGQQVLAVDTNGDTACGELVEQVTWAQGLFRCRAALAASRPVAAGAEALFHRTLRTNQDKRVTAHVSWNQYGLPHRTILLWNGRVTGREGTRRPLTMDTYA